MKKFLLISFLSVFLLFSGCSSCSLGHNFNAPTCETPSTCKKCGQIQGEALGHKWENATCLIAKTCSICGMISGSPLSETNSHTWAESTCSSPKTCTICGATEGSALAHQYSNIGICTICKATKEYKNSNGYFSKEELYKMAQHYIEQEAYPVYLSQYSSISEVVVKNAEEKLYGSDCFVLVFKITMTHNGKSKSNQPIAVVIEPITNTKYAGMDYFLS